MKKCSLRCTIYTIYPKDSISTTVERSDGFDNALGARYPTSKHYRTKFWGLELISVCSMGQRCVQRAEKAKPYQLVCTQSELQGSCTLYCDCRLDLGWLEQSKPQKYTTDVLTKLAFTQDIEERWQEKARSSQRIKTSSITRPLLTNVAPAHGSWSFDHLWDLALIQSKSDRSMRWKRTASA